MLRGVLSRAVCIARHGLHGEQVGWLGAGRRGLHGASRLCVAGRDGSHACVNESTDDEVDEKEGAGGAKKASAARKRRKKPPPAQSRADSVLPGVAAAAAPAAASPAAAPASSIKAALAALEAMMEAEMEAMKMSHLARLQKLSGHAPASRALSKPATVSTIPYAPAMLVGEAHVMGDFPTPPAALRGESVAHEAASHGVLATPGQAAASEAQRASAALRMEFMQREHHQKRMREFTLSQSLLSDDALPEYASGYMWIGRLGTHGPDGATVQMEEEIYQALCIPSAATHHELDEQGEDLPQNDRGSAEIRDELRDRLERVEAPSADPAPRRTVTERNEQSNRAQRGHREVLAPSVARRKHAPVRDPAARRGGAHAAETAALAACDSAPAAVARPAAREGAAQGVGARCEAEEILLAEAQGQEHSELRRRTAAHL
ncbi:hypothetical protein FVE85_6917 [Porphyridium purpureum]|uniref:Uncharacterized protein n=1 Tax=Porphyridium purpureum TaxID=35688 RepID=A0A5J4Z8F7_PORPP|nr:hypothetical protein FVE85_6917 [Porphyridium purpureum]|eukprot:POR1566..scf295_1